MLRKLSSQQAGTLGELLAVAKLNTLGLLAYISPEGAPGHDIMVVVEGQPKSIEVKTRQFIHRATEINRWPVDMDTKGDADYFLFVELNLRGMVPTFYLLSNSQARMVYKFQAGHGNCVPAQVRKLADPNDFSAIAPQKS